MDFMNEFGERTVARCCALAGRDLTVILKVSGAAALRRAKLAAGRHGFKLVRLDEDRYRVEVDRDER